MKKSVLILCTHNSSRSQMAEGLLRHDGGKYFDVESAGTDVTSVRGEAIEVLAELGIDISRHRSKAIQEFSDRKFDYVITVCDSAKESCPYFPGKKILHWSFEDPSKAQGSHQERLAEFRKIRDQIRRALQEFIEQERKILI